MAIDADINAGEEAELVKLVAKVSGAGVTPVRAMLKAAKAGKRAAAAQAVRDKASAKSTRVRVPAIPPDAEVGPVMAMIDSHLSAVDAPEPPMRDAEGVPVKITCRPSPGLHELTGRGTNDEEDETSRLPAPKNHLLTQHGKESLELLIGDYLVFAEDTPDGERYVAPPQKIVAHYLVYDRSALPSVYAVQTLPLVLPDDALLAGNGLDRKYSISFRLDSELLPFVPTLKED